MIKNEWIPNLNIYRNDTLDSNFEDSFRAVSTIHRQLRCVQANIKYLSNFCQIDTDLVMTNLTRLENQLEKLKETALFIQSATDQPTLLCSSH
jgi:hypothetical protein